MLVSGIEVLLLDPDPLHDPDGLVFEPFTSWETTFVAISNSANVELTAEANSSDYDYVVDNISLVCAPEPARVPSLSLPGMLALLLASVVVGAATVPQFPRKVDT